MPVCENIRLHVLLANIHKAFLPVPSNPSFPRLPSNPSRDDNCSIIFTRLFIFLSFISNPFQLLRTTLGHLQPQLHPIELSRSPLVGRFLLCSLYAFWFRISSAPACSEERRRHCKSGRSCTWVVSSSINQLICSAPSGPFFWTRSFYNFNSVCHGLEWPVGWYLPQRPFLYI